MNQSHLSLSARTWLDKADDERIKMFRMEKWIDYAVASEIMADWGQLLSYPERSRMPCRLLIADSNNGKTRLLRRFLSRHPGDPNIEGDAAVVPVLSTVLNSPDPKLLCKGLLRGLFEELPRRQTMGDLLEQLLDVLIRVRPKMILLDEVNTIISGAATKTRECFNTIKHISNVTGIPIVAAGTREALNGFRTDEQIDNRFEPVRLPRWEKGEAFRKLLAGFELVTPLKFPSNLSSRRMSEEIMTLTDGLIGEVASLIEKAATEAVKTKVEVINSEVLRSCGYRPVSARKFVK